VFWEALAYEWFGAVSAIQGKMNAATQEWDRAFDLTADQGLAGQYLLRSSRRAMVEATMLGDAVRGRRILHDALARFPVDSMSALNRPYGHLAMAHATLGEVSEARTLLAEYAANADADHARDAERWGVGAEGLIAFSEGRMAEALELLTRFDDGSGCQTCAYPWMARALEAMGQTDSAMALMETFVETPSSSIWYDASHLGYGYRRLGEYHEAQGNTQIAIRYFNDFVDLLRDSDPEFQPMVDEAKAALMRLGGDVAN
jgi:tetratricopeptide (TPR) repeat protein